MIKNSSGSFKKESTGLLSWHLRFVLTAILISVVSLAIYSQEAHKRVYVDNDGIMRWSDDSSELHGFGVNYTLPFAHEYRMAKRAGVNPEEAVKNDVYHMARLDLDFFRVHVWDTEISDTLGNLIDNEHLRLLDFVINEMENRGMKIILTPIAFWGNGWPEKDERTPGFSYKYGKAACLTDTGAISAEERYLCQFLNHVNRYTGIAYKDDPDIIGFEISNEPHHEGPAEEVTAYINKMVTAMRSTGYANPVFYNMSHSIFLADAYMAADIQGGTFQWYPAGLVSGHTIKGNFLPYVSSYSIPFAGNPEFKRMAKIVYEFDPADIAGNIMYPAMALTFRKTGMQLAAQFAYDALFNAPYNTNYDTHFMNLAYAPEKAISLMIASAVFHNVEMYRDYDDNTNVDGFSLNYSDDLAQWVTNKKFFYSNNTSSSPANVSELCEIAGYGSSPVVKYTGQGAYFIDKLSDGIWRLEVMPDAYWIDDPYGPVAPGRQKAAVVHSLQKITLFLPDLGCDFFATPLNKSNSFHPVVSNGAMEIMPGTYILVRKGVKNHFTGDYRYKNIMIGEFVAPATDLKKTVIWNNSPSEVTSGKPLKILFNAASDSPVKRAEVVMSASNRWVTVTATHQDDGSFMVNVPSDMVTTGFLDYRVIIYTSSDTIKYPGNIKGDPWNWNNRDDSVYTVRITPEGAYLILWDPVSDWGSTYKTWIPSVNLKPTANDETVLSIRFDGLPETGSGDQPGHCYAFKYFFGDKIAGRRDELKEKTTLAMKYNNLSPLSIQAEVGLIDGNGTAYAGEVTVDQGEGIIRLSLDSLINVSSFILPKPFPEFLPLKAEPSGKPFDLSSAEILQLVLNPGQPEKIWFCIGKIWLE